MARKGLPLAAAVFTLALLGAGTANADILYTMAPVPCSTRLFTSGTEFDSAPCGTISGSLRIEDDYVPGTFAIGLSDGSLDFDLLFTVTDAPSQDFWGFNTRSTQAAGLPALLRMPVLSGPANIRFGTQFETSVRTIGTELSLHDGNRFLGYIGVEHSTDNAIWTRVVPEPGTLVLLGVSLAGVALVRRRRRAPPAVTGPAVAAASAHCVCFA